MDKKATGIVAYCCVPFKFSLSDSLYRESDTMVGYSDISLVLASPL